MTCPNRALLALLLLLTLALPSPARAEEEQEKNAKAVPRYNLRQLVAMAQLSYPGVEAARQAVKVMEAKLYRAKWAWLPQATISGLVAPAPEVRCMPSEEQCIETTAYELNSLDIAGALLRVTLDAAMPLYTFDKIGSAKRAAKAGVKLRRSQVQTGQDKLAKDVARAYWGLKLARELIFTIEEGREHLVKAKKIVKEQLDSEDGEATLDDLYKIKIAFVEVDGRLLQARKLERLSMAGLATLTGRRGRPFDVDEKFLEVLPGKLLELKVYKELARRHRPDISSLKALLQAANAQVDLEVAKFFPNFLLVATAGAGYTSSADEPKNAFMSDPFNFLGAGFGLALNWKWDHVQQYGRYKEAKAQVRQVQAKRQEAMAGIKMELLKAYLDLKDARAHLALREGGAKIARKLLTAGSQNLAAGLSETEDLKDALTAFFTMELKRLQAAYEVNVGWAEMGRIIGAKAPKMNEAVNGAP